jgi:Bacterial pre-peptidase C-terminal domain
VVIGLLCAAVEAGAVAPHLASVLPTGGQRGTQVEVSFHGDRLQDTAEIICYEPGLEVLKLNPAKDNLVTAELKIAADCRLGEHHLRLRTATGVSELRTFFVGPYPVVAEKEPNNDLTNAQKVALNTTVTGIITSEDVDCFAVEARQGDRLSAEVEGMRLGRAFFDPRLAVLDSHGTVLADVDDTQLAMQDPFASLIVPADGTYILRLREATYGGNDNCHYRLHIGAFPRPTAVYPLGGKAGETLALTFFSEATGPFTQPVKLPPTPSEKFGVFAELDGLPAPSPNWIRVSDFANVLATSPNQDREHATATDLAPPLALNGVISKEGEEDWFRFKATKGVALDVDVYARRLGSPLDSVLEVFDAKGRSLAANDDSAGADSALKFTPPETTNYFVRIRDTLGQGGPDYGYRIEVTPVAPRLTVKIPDVARNDTQARQYIAVPRGNRFATLISARRANFGGELVFGAEGLPPGVTLEADRMAANIDAMPLVFEAAPDAPIGGRLLDLTATWTNGSSKVLGRFHQDIELVQGPNSIAYHSTSVDKLCVAVTRPAPFKLAIVDPKVPLVQAGSMRLEIAAEREHGFDEPIVVHMVWNPPGVSSQPEATIPKGATNVFYQLNAGGGAELRSWKIAVLGHAKVDGGQMFVSSQLADLVVAAPFLTGKIETLWVNPGKPGRLTVNLQPAKPFEGKATIRLCGLPERVSAPEKTITKDDQEVEFDLTVDSKCPTGSYRNLFCAVDVPEGGRVIPHTIAGGGILRVVPPKKEEPRVAAVRGEGR